MFLKAFPLELTVLLICAAFSVGLVLQQMPQAAVPAKQSTQQASTASQCQTKMEEWRQWLENVTTHTYPNTKASWQAETGKPLLQKWITHCAREVPGWTVAPTIQTLMTTLERQLNEPKQNPVTAQTQQDARAYIEEQYRNECTAKMDEFRLWFAKYSASANQQQLAAYREGFRNWVDYCSGHIPGWQPPFIVSAQ